MKAAAKNICTLLCIHPKHNMPARALARPPARNTRKGRRSNQLFRKSRRRSSTAAYMGKYKLTLTLIARACT